MTLTSLPTPYLQWADATETWGVVFCVKKKNCFFKGAVDVSEEKFKKIFKVDV